LLKGRMLEGEEAWKRSAANKKNRLSRDGSLVKL